MASPAEPQEDDGQNDETPLFRTAKKRKFNQRQRVRISASPPAPSLRVQNHESTSLNDHETTELAAGGLSPVKSIAGRKVLPRKRFGGGIEFSGSTTSGTISKDQQSSAVSTKMPLAEDIPLSLSSRFAPSTGMKRQENEERYLMAYIDSQLQGKSETALSQTAIESPTGLVSESATAPITSQPVAKEPATAGRLQEIDLGPRARRKNEKATLKASQHLATAANESPSTVATHLDSDSDSSSTARRKKKLPPKVRVNRHGRILPPRRSRVTQRSSAEIQRDRAVEEVLRSGGLDRDLMPRDKADAHAEPSSGLVGGSSVTATQAASTGEADEELVERFRREYFENSLANGSASGSGQAVNRHGGRNAASATSTGPKRGGSRSARMAATSGPGRGTGRGGGGGSR